eukprot:5914956-Pyramimonas_sp.AAC.1
MSDVHGMLKLWDSEVESVSSQSVVGQNKRSDTLSQNRITESALQGESQDSPDTAAGPQGGPTVIYSRRV